MALGTALHSVPQADFGSRPGSIVPLVHVVSHMPRLFGKFSSKHLTGTNVLIYKL